MDARLTRQLIYGLFLLFVLGICRKTGAGQVLNVAVAANYAPVIEQLGKNFELETSIPVQLTISSTGRLYSQIHSKAPFDLFFSADSKRPELLYRNGFCSAPILYATGRVVLWSKNENVCRFRNWQEAVTSPEVMKIATANPATAPYGAVAKKQCTQLTEWPVIEQKLVYGTNVMQAFQYSQSGVADVSFVALSLALSEQGSAGCFWEIPEAEVVEQMACAVTYGRNREQAQQFLAYATSDRSAPLRKQFGYN